MKKIILSLFAIISLNISANAQIFNETQSEIDTTKKPIIDFVPHKIIADNDTTNFYSTEIKVLNRGEGILKIRSIKASCYCSNGYVLENDIYTLSIGIIKFDINKKGLEEGQNSVVFRIYSNAVNSPAFYTVEFKKETKTESSNSGKSQ